MADDLLRFRPEFPILERTTYMISNSLGAMPRGVNDALHHYAETWNSRGGARLGGTVVDACRPGWGRNRRSDECA